MLSNLRLLVIALLLGTTCWADDVAPTGATANWHQAGGPHGHWRVAGQPPIRWSATRNENIVWRTTMPECGQSAVTIWGNRAFVTTHVPLKSLEDRYSASDINGYCLDADTGKILWKVHLPGTQSMEPAGGFSDATVFAPITDGRHVWFFNRCGSMGCYDLHGKQIWQRIYRLRFKHSNRQCEPIYFRGTILNVEVLDKEQGARLKKFAKGSSRTVKVKLPPGVDRKSLWTYIHGIDAKTGKVLWRESVGTSIHNTPIIGRLADGTPAIVHARGGSHGPLEKPYGVSLTSLANGQEGKTLWSTSLAQFDPVFSSHWNSRSVMAFASGKQIVLSTETGRVIREHPLYESADVWRFDRNKGDWTHERNVAVRAGKNSHPNTNQANQVVGDWHYFLSHNIHYIGRVHVESGRVEYLEVPAQLVADTTDPQARSPSVGRGTKRQSPDKHKRPRNWAKRTRGQRLGTHFGRQPDTRGPLPLPAGCDRHGVRPRYIRRTVVSQIAGRNQRPGAGRRDMDVKFAFLRTGQAVHAHDARGTLHRKTERTLTRRDARPKTLDGKDSGDRISAKSLCPGPATRVTIRLRLQNPDRPPASTDGQVPVKETAMRRHRIHILRLIAGLLTVLAMTPAVRAADQDKRPNFLFIIVDDQSPFDLKVYDAKSSLETPNIDQLAKQGVVFDSAHHMGAWAGAVCTASRHMVMTGRTVWHIPRRGGRRRGKKQQPKAVNSALVPANLPQFTMPAIFNRAGYDTMRTCKRGNSYAAANQLFSVVKDATRRGGTAESGSAWHAEQVLEYLKQRETANDSDPFLIYFGFSHPHDTRDGTPELLAKYGAVNHKDKQSLPPAHPKQPRLPVNYLPKHPFFHGHPNLRDEVNVSGVWKRRDERTIRNELGREFACSENIDIQIGRVLKRLKSMGELDNTYIIYTSDHGMAIGRHGLQGKQNLYEHTWRVPFIVKGPNIKPGVRVRGNIYLLDVLPTLCDLAGIKPPKTVEGKSFKPVLQGTQEAVREVLYGAYSGGTKPGMRSLKHGDWKLIKYDVMDGTVRETQLFNLAENPNEFLKEHGSRNPLHRNLASDPKFAAKRRELEQALLAEMRRLDDPFPLWDQPRQQ